MLKRRKNEKQSACAQLRAPGSVPCITRVYVSCSRLINSPTPNSALAFMQTLYYSLIRANTRKSSITCVYVASNYHKYLDVLTQYTLVLLPSYFFFFVRANRIVFFNPQLVYMHAYWSVFAVCCVDFPLYIGFFIFTYTLTHPLCHSLSLFFSECASVCHSLSFSLSSFIILFFISFVSSVFFPFHISSNWSLSLSLTYRPMLYVSDMVVRDIYFSIAFHCISSLPHETAQDIAHTHGHAYMHTLHSNNRLHIFVLFHFIPETKHVYMYI